MNPVDRWMVRHLPAFPCIVHISGAEDSKNAPGLRFKGFALAFLIREKT